MKKAVKAVLKLMRLKNFKCITDNTYKFGLLTRISGMNIVGKTTKWCKNIKTVGSCLDGRKKDVCKNNN